MNLFDCRVNIEQALRPNALSLGIDLVVGVSLDVLFKSATSLAPVKNELGEYVKDQSKIHYQVK